MKFARSLAAFQAVPPARRWEVPFPLGVFGTLRQGFRNHRLMQLGEIQACRLAFLPHFAARNIKLFFRAGSTAPFEVYYYEPQEWRKVIERIDQLEDFCPGIFQENGYQRTLAWLYLLPDGQRPSVYSESLAGERDLGIAPARWSEHEHVPCWIYSSVAQNRLAIGIANSPIIWDGIVRR